MNLQLPADPIHAEGFLRQHGGGDFFKWLHRQRRRDDAVGDVAREMPDPRWAVVGRDPAPLFLSGLLDLFDGSASFEAALLRAYREYLSSPSRRRLHARAVRQWRLLWSGINGKPRAPRMGHPRAISPRLRTRVMERDGFRCRRCGSGPAHDRLVVDHITPVAMGGTREETNLQTLCETCNQGKAGRQPHPHDLRREVEL